MNNDMEYVTLIGGEMAGRKRKVSRDYTSIIVLSDPNDKAGLDSIYTKYVSETYHRPMIDTFGMSIYLHESLVKISSGELLAMLLKGYSKTSRLEYAYQGGLEKMFNNIKDIG